MAQVPFTDLSGQAAAGTINVGVPDDYQRIQADPNAFGAQIGAGDQRLGGTLEQAGGTAVDVATQRQRTWNEATTNNAFTALKNKITNASWGDPSDPNSRGFLTTTGAGALNGYADAMSQMQDAQASIRAGLTPQQQLIFDRSANNLISATAATYDQHRATQQVTWANQAADASKQSSMSAAIAAPDEDTFLHNLSDGRIAILDQASRLGWSPEVITQQLGAYTSQSRMGQVERLQAVNPQTAWAKYQDVQNQMTGQDRLAIESRLRPALLTWGSRDDAEKLLAQGSAGSGGLPPGPVPDMVRTAATNQGVDPGFALTSAQIESHNGTLADRPGSQYQGVFQMGDAAWAARGGTAANRGDVPTQVNLGVANLKHSQDVATQALGQPAAPWQSYLVHQQGDAGGPALLTADPSASAVDTLAPAYKGDRAKATAAVVQNGGSAGMTAGQFLGVWQSKYQSAAAGLGSAAGSGGNASGQPAGRPYVAGDSLAAGLKLANGADGTGVVSAPPVAVLDQINAIPAGGLQGRTVYLSSGVSNAPVKDPAAWTPTVQQQLDSLKARGANVVLMGVGDRSDLAPLNANLQALAAKNGAAFVPIQPGPDHVHPQDYRALGASAARAQIPAANGADGMPPDPLAGQSTAPADTNARLQGMLGTFRMRQADPDGTAPDAASTNSAAPPAAPASGSPAPSAAPAANTSANATSAASLRPNLPALMEQANHLLDPFGQSNPQYIDLVQSRLRAKTNEIEWANREAEKTNRETLMTAAMGPPPGAGAFGAVGSAITAAGAPNPMAAPTGPGPGAAAPGASPALTPDGPATPPSRPTSLDQLFQNPVAKAAWVAATPETQRSIMGLIEHNARGEDPPMTPAAQTLYYQLSGQAVNDRESFQKLNLADPQYLSTLPHSYWNALAGEQRRFGNADVTRAAREESQARAINILKPDLLAAGFKTEGLKPGSTPAKDYDTFVGRLRESLDDFQQANNRRPNDGEVAKIGQTLLMQGTQRGTAGIFPWSSDSSTRAFQVDPSQFTPSVPSAARQGIVQAYQQRFGAPPTEGQITEAFMRNQAATTARQPARGSTGNTPPRGNASAPPAALPMARQDTPPAPHPAATTPAADQAATGDAPPFIYN